MTDIAATQSVSNPDVAAGVAQFLSPVVIDLTAIVVNGKQAHWHVRGANFVGVHELLDVIVDHAGDFADTAAERIRTARATVSEGIDPADLATTLATLEAMARNLGWTPRAEEAEEATTATGEAADAEEGTDAD